MAHFFHVSSHRCEASVCLLGQLTVFQDDNTESLPCN